MDIMAFAVANLSRNFKLYNILMMGIDFVSVMMWINYFMPKCYFLLIAIAEGGFFYTI